MLGWRILGHGDYKVDIPVLSKEEEELISAAQERFREATRSKHTNSSEESRALVEDILAKTAGESGIYLDRSQAAYLGNIAFMHIYGFGFLQPLLENPEIEEISIIGPGRPAYVYVRKQGWKKVNACFDDEKAIGEMINKMARNIGRHITMQNPRLDAMLPDGSRLHASLPPVSQGEITIRKFRDRPFSPRELAEGGTLSSDALALLSVLMQCDMTLLVAGNTASGKTTTLNALFSFVPWNDRVLITEETPEISVPHEHQLRMVANREMGISLKDLVYDSLRMRPDRMIVGEVRNKEETEALFDVLLAGQARGSYATFHAQSVDEALSRLKSFGVPENDLGSIDCIVVQRRMLAYDVKTRRNCEIRRVVEIAEVEGGARVLYRYGQPLKHGRLVETAAESFGMNRKEMMAELGRRRKLIEKAGPDYVGFYRKIQAELYGLDEDARREDRDEREEVGRRGGVGVRETSGSRKSGGGWMP
ncbi:CpaF family protein [Candidatus Micrarchaeota archaeon]|nr:CpaF family protein [Candidatus Micrarchaeota archaeon]